MIEFKNLTVKELLALQAGSLNELVSRKILRSANKPTGDLAEYIFCKAFDWDISNNSQNGYDAICKNGFKYQIKARQLVKNNHSERMLSAIRNLEDKKFDFLAGVLFKKDFSIYKAIIIPHKLIVDSNPTYSQHDNKNIFYLRDSIWHLPNVKDVTQELESVYNVL